MAVVARLDAKGVSLRVLSIFGNQTLVTSTSTGRLMLAVIGAASQAEPEAKSGRVSRGPKPKVAAKAVCRPLAGRLLRDYPDEV